jgi:hypothetical protein
MLYCLRFGKSGNYGGSFLGDLSFGRDSQGCWDRSGNLIVE